LPAKNNLPRENSLKKEVDIKRLLNQGRKISGDYFLAGYESDREFRFAVLVSKKLGPAVERNRIKRLFRESVRVNKKILNNPVSLVVLPKVTCNHASLESINAETSRIFELINTKV